MFLFRQPILNLKYLHLLQILCAIYSQLLTFKSAEIHLHFLASIMITPIHRTTAIKIEVKITLRSQHLTAITMNACIITNITHCSQHFTTISTNTCIIIKTTHCSQHFNSIINTPVKIILRTQNFTLITANTRINSNQ